VLHPRLQHLQRRLKFGVLLLAHEALALTLRTSRWPRTIASISAAINRSGGLLQSPLGTG
jgi:hypothetical protein